MRLLRDNSNGEVFKTQDENSDRDITFAELCQLLIRLGFIERIKGSHHIFSHENIEEIINIQPNNGKAKPYQVKQVRIL